MIYQKTLLLLPDNVEIKWKIYRCIDKIFIQEFVYHRKGKIISMIESGDTEALTCPKCGNHNFILK